MRLTRRKMDPIWGQVLLFRVWLTCRRVGSWCRMEGGCFEANDISARARGNRGRVDSSRRNSDPIGTCLSQLISRVSRFTCDRDTSGSGGDTRDR